MKAPVAASIGWLALAAPVVLPAQETPHRSATPSFRSLRYEEDFSHLKDPATRTGNVLALEPLKFVPLDRDGECYLSLGGEIRQQYEFIDDPDFGLAAADGDGYLLQRYLLHADFRLGPSFRCFGQLASALSSFQDIPPGPADVNRLDVHQAFADFGTGSAGTGDDALTLRAGRQEMLYGSQRLVSVREGPNVRRTFDACRVLSRFGEWRVDAFLSRPVETDPGRFDDWGDGDALLWGVYCTAPVATSLRIDLYYLGLDQPDASFEAGTADEVRHSVGARWFGETGRVDYNFEGVYQWGKFDGGGIRAWTLASDTGYTFADAPLAPRLAIRVDISSGDDDPNDGELGTFNPLYPRGNYFGEAAILGPLNLIDVHPMARLQLSDTTSFEAAWTWYWRTSKQDGVYGSGLNLIQDSAGSEARYIGNELSVLFEWQIDRHLAFTTSFSHFFAETFLTATGPGEDVDYVMAMVTYRF